MNRIAHFASALLPWLLGLAIAAVPFYKGLFNVAVVAYALTWLLAAPVQSGVFQRLRTQSALWWLLALTAWVGVGLLYGEAGADELVRPAVFMVRMLIVVMAALALREDQKGGLLKVFVVAQTVVLVATYAQKWGASGYWIGVSITDHISQNLMQSLLVAIALWRARYATRAIHRWLWRALAVFAAYGVLMLSTGRTGYLALLAVVLVFIVWRRQWWYLPAGLVGVALLAAAAYGLSPRFQHRVDQVLVEVQMQGDRAEQTSTGARVAMWSFATDLISQKPIAGFGSGGYPGQAREHFTDQYTCSVTCAHTHNQFLFFAVENGLIGLFIYLTLLVALMRNALADPSHLGSGVAASYIAILIVDSLTHGPFWIAREFYFFSSLLPLMLVRFHAEPQEEQT